MKNLIFSIPFRTFFFSRILIFEEIFGREFILCIYRHFMPAGTFSDPEIAENIFSIRPSFTRPTFSVFVRFEFVKILIEIATR